MVHNLSLGTPGLAFWIVGETLTWLGWTLASLSPGKGEMIDDHLSLHSIWAWRGFGSSRWKRMRQVSSLRTQIPHPRKLSAVVPVGAHISCSHHDPSPSPKASQAPHPHQWLPLRPAEQPLSIGRAPAHGTQSTAPASLCLNLEFQNSEAVLPAICAGNHLSPQQVSSLYSRAG